jgi:hypothetical protein
MVSDKKFTNLNPNLHIDLLKSQYAIFSLILKRMRKDKNSLAGDLEVELWELKHEIKYDNRNKW